MTDKEIRDILLQKFYELRTKGMITLGKEDFTKIIYDQEIIRGCEQLAAEKLIEWRPVIRADGHVTFWQGKITVQGSDRVEGVESPYSTQQNIHIGNFTNSQLGNHNVQNIQINNHSIEKLHDIISKSSSSEAEKEEANSLISRAANHPLFNTIAGVVLSNVDKVPADKVINFIKDTVSQFL